MDTYLLNITRLNSPFLETSTEMNETALEVLLDELDADDPSHKAWELAYSYKDQYDMDDLSPASFVKLIERMQADGKLLARYYRC